MITETIFNAVDPGSQQISASQQIDQRYMANIQFIKSGVTGNPQVYVEYSSDDTNWDILSNPDEAVDYVQLDDDTTTIILLDNPAKFLRFRMESNGASGGTITAKMNRKEAL